MKLSFFLDKDDMIRNEFALENKLTRYSKDCIIMLGNMAWNMGVLASLNISNFDDLDTLTKPSVVTPSDIIFSDYNSLTNEITLYKDTILEHFLPNVPTRFSKYTNYNDAIYLLKLHEYFHYLQCTNFQSLAIFRLNCLNEIAAYSFSQKISGISFE